MTGMSSLFSARAGDVVVAMRGTSEASRGDDDHKGAGMSPSPTSDPTAAEATQAVIDAARAYAKHSHGNIGNPQRYRAREEARDVLLDALARLDAVSSPVRLPIAIQRESRVS